MTGQNNAVEGIDVGLPQCRWADLTGDGRAAWVGRVVETVGNLPRRDVARPVIRGRRFNLARKSSFAAAWSDKRHAEQSRRQANVCFG